ncbi:QacE family quaternary ammonium compound efflux SMR transporter [Bacillus sp. HMF5848]|uniref:DMT family transporter n=1 Tax=Bacillus sp. HMF5848 TaxID=2495421 RepID=UPI000F778B13|nr:SMR family transporter [Bacillus sp. HMF5848]RSK28486.1 QacE family quaternary ammonium compound efflux SMR transporter [Bacillus sp. HMF5848]
MNKQWVLVFSAALFEVLWVIGLKYGDSVLDMIGTSIAIAVSFAALIYSSKVLPTSTVYAVFVGLGTVGSVISEMIWFGVPFKWSKVILIIIMLIGIIGLKVVTPEKEGEHA